MAQQAEIIASIDAARWEAMDKGIVPDFEIVAPTGTETNFVFEEQLNGFKNRYEAPTIQGLIDLIEAHRLYLKNRSIKPSTDSAN